MSEAGKSNGSGGARALSISVRPDGVAVVTYDVPGEAVNTLKEAFTEEFDRVADEIAKNPAIKAAILVSGKRDTWIAGADIEMLKGATTAAQAEAMCRKGQRSVDRIVNLSKPIVAAIHGAALGGGLEIALVCHARVLSSDLKTQLGLPEVQLGLLPGIDGLQRLAAIVGLQVALDYGLTGKSMRAVKAKSLGVADDVVPAPILHDVAARLALKLAEKGAPFKVRSEKKKGLKLDMATLQRAALEENPIGRAL
ncbi:MAG TPA: enoyl-CoA hydratase-related protein, partial [Polyangiaceae bacterium]|nr:enoyl-CoA hydratase-related protein [Polyangiaceae bacterium]